MDINNTPGRQARSRSPRHRREPQPAQVTLRVVAALVASTALRATARVVLQEVVRPAAQHTVAAAAHWLAGLLAQMVG